MPGRGMGERLQVDPNDTGVLYLGTEGGNGLWRSTDSGVTWAKVSSFTNVGTYVADPTDPSGYQTTNQGVVWVTFDPTQRDQGIAHQDDLRGRRRQGQHRLPVTDAARRGGIAGQPTGFIAHKGVFDAVGKQLYLATSDTGGPYDGGQGDLWRLDAATGAWTQISPVPSSSSDNYFGYSGLTIDRQHPNTIMAVTQISWFPDIQVFRSTDRGATWPGSGTGTATPTAPCATPSTSRGAVARLRQAGRSPGAEPQARLDDRVLRDRPVRLGLVPLRHGRDDLRRQQPHAWDTGRQVAISGGLRA